ncbi:MAG: penicillin-binding protein activator [Rhodospirillaceae bacterium]|nr:penicillin-binding protein activator [Rhodospirillaceae bacterium]
MVFILIEPVIRLFATNRSRSSSFLLLAFVFLPGCQSEHQKSLRESNQIRLSTNSHAIVKNAPKKKSHLNVAVGAHYKKEKNNLHKYKLDTIANDQLKAPASQGIKNPNSVHKESRHNENITKKIGVLLPLSQNSTGKGAAFLDAIQLALFEAANDDIELIIIDTKGDPESAVQAAGTLIKEEVKLILGPFFSGSTEAIAPLTKAAKIPVISFSNNTKVAGDGVYVFGFLPGQQITRILEYSLTRGYRRIGILVPANDFGRLSLSVAHNVSDRMDVQLVSELFFNPNSSDFSNAVREFAEYDSRNQKLKLQKKQLKRQSDEIANTALNRLSGLDTLGDPSFDAVLLPSGGAELRIIAPLLAFFDVDPSRIRLLGSTLWDNDKNLNLEPALIGGWYAAPSPELRKPYEVKFERVFGYSPPRLSSLAYDAMLLAVKLTSGKLGVNNSSTLITDPKGFLGVDGIVRFLKNGTNERGLAILEVGPDGVKVIDKAPKLFFKSN